MQSVEEVKRKFKGKRDGSGIPHLVIGRRIRIVLGVMF
jgi:hypothetical protein